MKSKHVLGLLFSLSIIICNAQRTRVEIVFKNGEVKEGYGQLTNSNQIKFKSVRKAKKQFFSFDQVDTLKVFNDNNSTLYVRVGVRNQSNPQILEVAQIGEKVILYRSNKQGYTMTGMGTAGGGAPMMGHFYTISNSYVRRPGEDEAFHLGSNQLFTKNFKNAASDYFSDCLALVQKIMSKEFKKRDLDKIITFYNTNCE